MITLGRGADPANLLASPTTLADRKVELHESPRGGDITFHGPGQLIAYPVIGLGEGKRDVRAYVTNLEEVVIRTVADFGVEARRVDGRRGVWVGNNKVAAIGVRISRWITSHGLALNVEPDLSFFDLIVPCGIRQGGVTSLARLTGARIPMSEVEGRLVAHFSRLLGYDAVREVSVIPPPVVPTSA